MIFETSPVLESPGARLPNALDALLSLTNISRRNRATRCITPSVL